MPQLAIEASHQLMLESPEAVAARTALVPLTYERAAWNIIQRANPHHEDLPHHNSLLTAEQAKAINEYYDIELGFGPHGFGINHKPPGLLYAQTAPTQREFRSTNHAVNELQEGDTLLLEGRGFHVQPPKPVTAEKMADMQATLDALEQLKPQDLLEFSMITSFKQIGALTLKLVETAKLISGTWYAEQAEHMQSQYMGSTWAYAGLLAISKGVTLRFADYDRFDDIKATERTGKNSLEQMLDGGNDSDIDNQLQFLRIARHRERIARNAVKDWALSNLPPAGTPPPVGRKPKLLVLFGAGHRDSMIQAFKDLGLQFTVRDLEESSAEERIHEHVGRDLQELLPLLNLVVMQTTMHVLESLGAQMQIFPSNTAADNAKHPH